MGTKENMLVSNNSPTAKKGIGQQEEFDLMGGQDIKFTEDDGYTEQSSVTASKIDGGISQRIGESFR